MNTMQRIIHIAAAAALGLSLAGCESTPTMDASPDSGVSPVSQRDAQRKAAWAEAVKDLSFDAGVVEVANAPARSDMTLARRMMREGETELEFNRKLPAVKAFGDAVRAAPEMPDAYMGLGRAMTLMGKTDQVIACYRTVIQMQPENIAARADLANALARATRQDEAIAEMDAVLELDPDYAPAHERLAIWHYYAGDYSTSWDHVHAARSVGHTMPPQFINLLQGKMAEPGGR